MTQLFYFDTSVFGGVFDEEFEEESLILFEKVKLGQIICVYSDLTEKELSTAPNKIQHFFKSLDNNFKQIVRVNEAVLNLAKTYINENVVGPTSLADCIHIALATINKVDILVSWNFKHIVNVYRIRGYNSINLRLGYSTLEIRSPKDIVGNENKR